MANKIVKVINTDTQEVFEAGIEWFNLNRKNHELYKEPIVDTVDYYEPLSKEMQEKLDSFEITEPEVQIMVKSKGRPKNKK